MELHFLLPNGNALATSPSEIMVANGSFFFEFKLKEYFHMTTCKTHIILALMTRVLLVQESIEDCLQENSVVFFADAIVSTVLLFLKNDWETTFGKCSLCFDPFTWVFRAVKQCAAINTFYLVICWLFSTFCNHGLYFSFFSHMSWKFYMLLLTLF